MELSEAARLAFEAALSEGAGDAEAYAQREIGREVRVHGGEVESLTAATERGIGVRAWIGGRTGYAYGTELSEAALRDLGARAGIPGRAPLPRRAVPTRTSTRSRRGQMAAIRHSTACVIPRSPIGRPIGSSTWRSPSSELPPPWTIESARSNRPSTRTPTTSW